MKYAIDMHKKCANFYINIEASIAIKIVKKLEILAENPYQNNLDIAKLEGYEHHYRLRVGKYRILYEIIDTQILIYAYDADSRGDIY